MSPMRRARNFTRCVKRGADYEADWQRRFDCYAKANPAKAAEFKSMLSRRASRRMGQGIAGLHAQGSAGDARIRFQSAEAAILPHVWNLFGGAADLNESTFTDVKGGGEFRARRVTSGRNMHFGIREHAMCAILNGIALHGGFIPYGSSFFVFTDYCRPSIRLAALMEIHVIYRLHA